MRVVQNILKISYHPNHNQLRPPPVIQHLFANAGSDTTICMPHLGTGNIFTGILNARASSDDSGKIISYLWSEIDGTGYLYPDGQTEILWKDSTAVSFLAGLGVHKFNLEVRDDQGRVANDQVTINVVSLFSYEYDALSLDSTAGLLKTISVKFEPGLMESWPDIDSVSVIREVYLINYNGQCHDISSWTKLPYVPYDSIQLTDKPVFYSLLADHRNPFDQKDMYGEIYARSNSGTDFNQKVSVGFIIASPWDY